MLTVQKTKAASKNATIENAVGHKLQVRWVPSAKRWKKNYTGYVDGQKKYLQWYDPTNSPHTVAGYKMALAAWNAFKADLEAERRWDKPNGEQYRKAISIREKMLTHYQEFGNTYMVGKFGEEIANLLKTYNSHSEPPALPTGAETILPNNSEQEGRAARYYATVVDPTHPELAGERVAGRWDAIRELQEHKAEANKDVLTIAGAIKLFLEAQQARVELKKKNPKQGISEGTYKQLKYKIKFAEEFPGSQQPLADLNGQWVDGFANYVSALGKGEDYDHHVKSVAKQFLLWLYELEYIQALPRNMKKLAGKRSARKVVPFTKADVETIFAKAEGRLRLYMLLMLNCGMTQADVASLKPSEIDWQAGTITRKRTKEEHEANVPVVTYKLWPEAFSLLKKYGKRTGGFVLSNETNADQLRPKRVYEAYTDFAKANNINSGKTLKYFRKTGSTMLQEHKQIEDSMVRFFLGQAPLTVAEKHYAPQSQAKLFELLEWLGQQFGFVKK